MYRVMAKLQMTSIFHNIPSLNLIKKGLRNIIASKPLISGARDEN